MTPFKEFLSNVIVEELHPELKDIVVNKSTYKSKQTQLANKIKELTERGEKTGIEGNMPKGSSRAYMKHEEKEKIHIDGKPTDMEVGTKVAIRSSLDKHHNEYAHDGLKLGAMQNRAEGGDHWVNKTYRTLTETDKPGHFKSNHDSGIFPPLIDHDHEGHEWSKVGHVRDASSADWKKITKTDSHPKGITHQEFYESLMRFHNKNNGKYWDRSPEKEKHLDHIEEHPLVQRFIDYHSNTGNSPTDYQQKKNLGVWKHPIDGSEHIVARDHGFDSDVESAYATARKNMFKRYN